MAIELKSGAGATIATVDPSSQAVRVTQYTSAGVEQVPASAANQATTNASLASIDSKIGTLGQKTMSGSTPVVLASDQSILTARIASSATAATAGLFPTTTGYGTLRTSPESSSLFNDPFDTEDTVNNWTLKTSTGTSSIASGVLSCASSTTASAYGGRFSIPTFRPKGITFLAAACAVRFTNSTIANTARWIGLGTLPATPTTVIPVTDGVGFLLDGAGSLFGKIYSAGVEIGSVNLTAYKPADNTFARFAVVYRSDLALFYVSTTEYPVGSIQSTNPNVQTFPLSVISIAGATPPASSATIDLHAIGVGDTGRNQQGIADGDFPSRIATVKLASTAASTTDKPLVVAFHPSSPAFAKAADLVVSTTGAAGAAVTATLPAAGAGLFHYITNIEIVCFAAALRVAAATPVVVTTTNIAGSLAYSFKANAMTQGDSEVQQKVFDLPLKSTTANTATTIVCPLTTSVIWRVNVHYYTAT